MSSPQVSVIIPTHDRRAMMMLTLQTVLWQEDVDFEVIVVDDGSSDGTGESLAALDDGRLRVLRHEAPQGVSAARNRGIAAARGAWIAFLDDDDLWAPNKLAAQLDAAVRSDATWSYTGAVEIDEGHAIVGGKPPPSPAVVVAELPAWNLVPGGCSGVIVMRGALASSGGFDPRLVNLADWDLWIRLGRTSQPVCVPDPLVGYRIHRGQSSLDVGSILKEAALIDRRYGTAIDRGGLHNYLAYRCLVAGRKGMALKHFVHAALLGRMSPVIRQLSVIARNRLAGRLSLPRRPDPYAPWRRQAQAWLESVELFYGDPSLRKEP